MRVKITYSYDPQASAEYPCWAKSELNGRMICTCGKDWQELRKEHIARLSTLTTQPEPPVEETIEL